MRNWIVRRLPFKDLREFMDLLEREKLLARVKVEVEPEWEVNGICRKLQDENGPAVLFEKVKGYPFCSLLANLFSTLEMHLLALETTKEKLYDTWFRGIENPINPKMVSNGPCKDHVIAGENVDITKFPVPLWHKHDGGRYIFTLALINTKDPDTGRVNAGIYRGMILTRKTSTLYIDPSQHGYIDFLKYKAKDKPMPAAAVIGYDPVLEIVGAGKYRYEDSEYAIAGGYRGEPVEMVKCETIDMEVPATAEIVLEGEVAPNKTVKCGPFGEYLGYYGGVHNALQFEVKAMTYRDEPIFLGCLEGRFPNLTGWSNQLKELTLKAYLRKTVEGIVDVHLPGMCGGMLGIVSIEKKFPGHAQKVIGAVWGGPYANVKNLIVVDNDVNPRDLNQVFWAISTRSVPDRDLTLSPKHMTSNLDPSQPPSMQGTTVAMGVDATKPLVEYEREGARFPETCDDPDIKKKVEAQWTKYGIKCAHN